ncbi:MAG: HAMP domain-containing histidine kinase [Desulfobulbaceae bacterium]|nr:HAMP domain-containing histidine kinase [Desulfobulbaceae bacterium]
MFTRGLKSSLVVNLLLVLAGAMLLIDLVMLGAARQSQLRERLRTGQTLLTAVGTITGEQTLPLFALDLRGLLAEADAGCLKKFDAGGNLVFEFGLICEDAAGLKREALRSLVIGQPLGMVSGDGPGFFWPGQSALAVCRPLTSGQGGGVIAAELSLSSLYQSLRNSQRAFFVYFLINLTLFIMLGFFRLYRSIVKPIDHLVTTAAEFRDDNEFVFRSDNQDSEFNRLSRSLNQMLSRIKRDRAKLEETVASLEAANQGLRRAQKEIIRAEKLASVGRLSAGIAHEIGNPMGIIAAYLELLKQPGLAPQQRDDFIRRAEGEAGRVNNIIRQLLDFARPTREEVAAEISVHGIIEEVRELCAIQPLLAGVIVRVESGAENDQVVGSGDQIKQIFLNLILNAADAINGFPGPDRTGVITIRTANGLGADLSGRDVAGLWIEVLDNGPGFIEAELTNVFDPFYTTKEPGKGTGLGLSICFTIVENLGGSIIAATNPDGGARIRLFLPQVLTVSSSTSKET